MDKREGTLVGILTVKSQGMVGILTGNFGLCQKSPGQPVGGYLGLHIDWCISSNMVDLDLFSRSQDFFFVFYTLVVSITFERNELEPSNLVYRCILGLSRLSSNMVDLDLFSRSQESFFTPLWPQ